MIDIDGVELGKNVKQMIVTNKYTRYIHVINKQIMMFSYVLVKFWHFKICMADLHFEFLINCKNIT